MKLDAILFDLDGTLLPMDNDLFTRGYLHLLAEAMEEHGYEERSMTLAMWKGVSAMVKNDGSEPNIDAFCRRFGSELGRDARRDIPLFDAFYLNGFAEARALTSPTPLARTAVSLAKEKANKVVLATNPLFPRVAIEVRLSWAGLSADDFDLVTDYETSRSCKPNPAYYAEIMKKISSSPERSLMIGNNADEDARASLAAGLSAYLVTDCLIGDPSGLTVPSGSLADLTEWLKALPV